MLKKAPQPNTTTVNSDVQRQCFKTKLCAFFPLNKCQKGTNCPFAHDSSEMRDQPDWRKTKVCLMWKSNNCDKPADLCNYAHGAQELRRGITSKHQANGAVANDKNRVRDSSRRQSKEAMSDTPTIPSPNKKGDYSASEDMETAASPSSKDVSNRFQNQVPLMPRNYNNMNYYRDVQQRSPKNQYNSDWLENKNLYCGSPVVAPASDREMFRPVSYVDRRFMESSPMITATPDLVGNVNTNGSNDDLFMDMQPSFSGYASPAIAESPHMNEGHWVETPVLIRGSCSLYDNSSMGEDQYRYQAANSPAFTNETISSPPVGIESTAPWSPPLPHSSPLMASGYDHFRTNDMYPHFREDRRNLFARDVNTLGSEDCNYPRK